MTENQMEKNRVSVIGKVVSVFCYSHQRYGECFYMLNISVSRTSGQNDIIPLTISEKLVDVRMDYSGFIVSVKGQFRSHNLHEAQKSRLMLSVFVQEIDFLEWEDEEIENNNQILLAGYLCKAPVYRKTPKGREIADILLAVNRPYGKSDYIPCIAWVLFFRLKEYPICRLF